jgi:hypothetical protein
MGAVLAVAAIGAVAIALLPRHRDLNAVISVTAAEQISGPAKA